MLTSFQNPLVKQIRKLHHSRGRKKQQLLLLEGTHLVQEACIAHYPLQTVCHTPTWQSRHPQLWQQMTQWAQRCELVSDEVLKALTTTPQPDGVVATATRGHSPLQPNPVHLGLFLETIQDPGNLGTMIRTAVATGVDRLWLSQDSVDLDHPKVLRASAGQYFHLSMQICDEGHREIQRCQSQGIQVVATQPQAKLAYWDVDLTPPTLILLGNEGAGLSAPLLAMADRQVQIPLAPQVESLNVAIVAALILYEAKRQRQVAKFYPEANG